MAVLCLGILYHSRRMNILLCGTEFSLYNNLIIWQMRLQNWSYSQHLLQCCQMPWVNLTWPGMGPGGLKPTDPGMPSDVCHQFWNQGIRVNNTKQPFQCCFLVPLQQPHRMVSHWCTLLWRIVKGHRQQHSCKWKSYKSVEPFYWNCLILQR